MADRSWGSGWPHCDSPRVTIARHDGLRVSVHRDLAELVRLLMDLTELSGYDIKPGQTWGFACRPIRNTQRASNHSWATAVDINSLENPQRRPLTTNIPRKVREMWKSHGFRWGGDYQSSTPDPMHFEFMGTVAQARTITARLRRFLGTAAPPPVSTPTRPNRPAPRRYPGPARRGDRGDTVRVWQQLLRDRGYSIAVDGIFGVRTEEAVTHWQMQHNPPLEVDGIAGPATWHWLLYA